MPNSFLSSLLRAIVLASFGASAISAQTTPSAAPLRVGIAGLVHGHVSGFLQQNLHRTDIQIVGVAEADKKLSEFIAQKFGLAPDLFFSDVDDMLDKAKPQAVSFSPVRSIIAGRRDLRPPRHTRHDGKTSRA